MHHDHPTNTKAASPSPAVCGICAVAAAFLLTAVLPDPASAAEHRNGSLKGRNIWGCDSREHYVETAHAFDAGKAEGQKALDEHIKEGVCKMLKTGAKATITRANRSEQRALKVQIEGESKEWWIAADNYQRD